MKAVFVTLFFALAVIQPNAQKGEANGVITALQFFALMGTALTPTGGNLNSAKRK